MCRQTSGQKLEKQMQIELKNRQNNNMYISSYVNENYLLTGMEGGGGERGLWSGQRLFQKWLQNKRRGVEKII